MTDRVFRKGNLQMHARLQGGSLYIHEVLDGEKVVGAVSTSTVRKKGVTTTSRSFSLTPAGGGEPLVYDDLDAFRRAYEQKLRDIEFDAAAPKTP